MNAVFLNMQRNAFIPVWIRGALNKFYEAQKNFSSFPHFRVT